MSWHPIAELVGPMSDGEIASLFGRRSASRGVADDLTGGRCLVELPLVEQDASLRYAAKDAVHRARRLAEWRDSRNSPTCNEARTFSKRRGRPLKRQSVDVLAT